MEMETTITVVVVPTMVVVETGRDSVHSSISGRTPQYSTKYELISSMTLHTEVTKISG